MHPIAQSQFGASTGHPVYFRTTGQLHLSDATISLDEMIFHQKRMTESDLRELIWQCRDRYCFALELINRDASFPDSLFDRSALDLGEFYLPWAGFCASYRRLIFETQIDLFEDQRARELRKWGQFLEKECFARITGRAEWVRCVLETAGLLPTQSPDRDVYVDELFEEIIEILERQYGEEDEPAEK